jgi:protein gp37
MARRLQAIGVPGYENGFKLSLLPERLHQPLQRRKPTMYFVNSMSDLFQDEVPQEFINEVMGVIRATPHHTYQILTKRSSTMLQYFSTREVPGNAWLGVSVEDRKYGLPRIQDLVAINAKTRFLSIEPLLEDLGKIRLRGIHWVIVGGESGFGARPMREEWAISIRNQCLKARVDFFFKQWGAWGADGKQRNKKANGRILDGKIWDMIPAVAV